MNGLGGKCGVGVMRGTSRVEGEGVEADEGGCGGEHCCAGGVGFVDLHVGRLSPKPSINLSPLK